MNSAMFGPDHGNEASHQAVIESIAESGPIGTGRAHAKVILLGEHAVVYGAPALAVPLPQLTVAVNAVRLGGHAKPGDVSFTTADATPPMADDTVTSLRDLVALFRDAADVEDQTALSLLVDCMIPPGRGLGSSAACARAVVLALADLFHRHLADETVFHLVQAAETTAHGKSSGVDALVTGSAGIIRYVSGTAEQVTCGFDGVFVVADSGVSGRTKDAIEHVRRTFQDSPAVESTFMRRVRDLAEAAGRAIVGGQLDVFGARMSDNHAVLRDIGLSTDRIDALVAAALRAGGRGAKISGGGLGGCIVALAGSPGEARTIADALRTAGAVNTWFIPVGRYADGGR